MPKITSPTPKEKNNFWTKGIVEDEFDIVDDELDIVDNEFDIIDDKFDIDDD